MTAEFDFRQGGEPTWDIAVEADEGRLLLSAGGARLAIDGVVQAEAREEGNLLVGEYPHLYARMAALVRSGGIDMDLAPMVHVADAFLIGERVTVDPFIE
jgi:D-galactose 1-dehydrogenase